MASDWSFGAGQGAFRPNASGALQDGQSFGSYKITGTLGQGAHGVVYRAKDPAGREVAVKILKSRLDAKRRERFRREGKITAGLNHPGIVRIFAGGESGGVPFLVYELVEGVRELDDYFRGLDLAARVRALQHVAEAVGYAHEHGVVHRDLKAANVLVDQAGRVRVADFGLAKEEGAERMTRTGALLGTPAAMAPEQIVGLSQSAGPPADVWALGVMLYEALCDRLPFDAETFPDLQAKILRSDPDSPGKGVPGVSQDLEAVCLKALEKDPADRYADGLAFAADLGRTLNGEPTVAGSARRGVRTWPLIVLAGVATLTLLGVLGALALRTPLPEAVAPEPVAARSEQPSVVAPPNPPGQSIDEEGPSDSLRGGLRFFPDFGATCGLVPLTAEEWSQLDVWRLVYCSTGSWSELGRRLDPAMKINLDFLVVAAQRDPERFRRWAFACYLKGWQHGDAAGLLFAGEWLFDTHDPAQEKWGFVLVRYAASRNQASPRVKLESAKELSKAYLPGLGSTAVAVFKPNPRLAAAWLAVARARGLSTTRVSHTRLVSLLGEATTIPDTEREAWRWIAEEESESGTWPKPEFFKGSTLAVESSRERVVRLATELAPVEGGELRSFAVAVPSGGELLEGVEQLGDGGSLRRLGELIGASDAVGPRAAEFGYRILLRAAISGSRAARRSIRKRSDVGAEAVSAWLRLGRGSSESTEGYRRKVETVATFGGDPPASDDEAWDRIASSLKARYADEGSANGR